MSTSLQLLHLGLRSAFRTCAQRNRLLTRTLAAPLQQKPNSSICLLIPRRTARAFASAKPSTQPQRRLADVERDIQRQHKRLQKAQEHQAAAAEAPPEARQTVNPRVLIYHGRMGKIGILVFLNIIALFSFGTACTIVAPAFFASDNPWWSAPLSKPAVTF